MWRFADWCVVVGRLLRRTLLCDGLCRDWVLSGDQRLFGHAVRFKDDQWFLCTYELGMRGLGMNTPSLRCLEGSHCHDWHVIHLKLTRELKKEVYIVLFVCASFIDTLYLIQQLHKHCSATSSQPPS